MFSSIRWQDGVKQAHDWQVAMLRTVFSYLAILCAAVAIGYVLTENNAQRHLSEQRLQVTEASLSLSSAIEQSLNEKVLVTEGIAAIFETEPDLSTERFTHIVASFVQNSPEVVNVAAAPNLVIEYVYPFEENKPALGLNLRQRPDFMIAVDRSMFLGTTVIDGPHQLVQGGEGFITRSPVMPTQNSVNSEPDQIWGIVSLVIGKDALFSALAMPQAVDAMDYSIQSEDGGVLFGEEDLAAFDPVVSQIGTAGVNWRLSAIPKGGWDRFGPRAEMIWGSVLVVTIIALALNALFQWLFQKKRRAETQLMEAIEALDDGFALFGEDDRLIVCNSQYKEFYKESAPAIVPGASFEKIISYGLKHEQYQEAFGREDEWLAKRLELHRSSSGPMEQLLKDGRWLRVDERKTASGNIVGFRVDITALKEALEKAEKASEAKSEFLNTVSHELRTPLTVILGYNAFIKAPESLQSYKQLRQALNQSAPADVIESFEAYHNDLKKFSNCMDASGQQLMALIGSILDLSSIDEGTLNLKKESLSLKEICKTLVLELMPLAEKKGLTLELYGDESIVLADRVRLKQILFNLVSNAIKFTQKGGVKLRLSSSDSRVWVEVIDTGPGINQSELEMIFDRYCLLNSSNDRENCGVGLGLPISKMLAELHDGSIAARSQPGEGSVFCLELKAHDRERDVAA